MRSGWLVVLAMRCTLLRFFYCKYYEASRPFKEETRKIETTGRTREASPRICSSGAEGMYGNMVPGEPQKKGLSSSLFFQVGKDESSQVAGMCRHCLDRFQLRRPTVPW